MLKIAEKLLIYLGFAFCLTMGMPGMALASENGGETGAALPTAADAVEAPAPPHRLTALEAVGQAKKLLQQELDKRVVARGGKAKTYEVSAAWAEVVLALWNRETDEIHLFSGAKRGSSLRLDAAGAPKVRVTLSSGLLSRYAVDDGKSVVVGLIYPLLEEKGKGKNAYLEATEIVYVPYSSALRTPEVLAAGSDYLSFRIQDAMADLRAKGTRSVAHPDRLLVDVIDPYLVKSVMIIEHTNQRQLLSLDAPESEVAYFLARLGLNGEAAYDQAVSSAGAAGLVQFIPSTYKRLVATRPDLGLIASFEVGMADHRNAIKAEIAYLDASLADMPESLQAACLADPVKASEILAAAYNGGSVRVRRAYALWGDEHWFESHAAEINRLSGRNEALIDSIELAKRQLKKAVSTKDKNSLNAKIAKERKERAEVLARLAEVQRASLKDETVWYVAKLKKVYGMLLAGMFATPQVPNNALPTPVAAAALPLSSQIASTTGAVCFSDGGCAAIQ
ncbi:MAG: transglycosylase SLT domain-containing protein [Patescibacteria group bacterium]|nr:transglycosylase SLT domain-containing protein [Patescibacteria group bacterium]